jgi:hypothetical protein
MFETDFRRGGHIVIDWLNLLWIVPMAFLAGCMLCALMVAAEGDEVESEIQRQIEGRTE